MNTVAVRQAVAADIDALSGLFDQYRQFQGKSADLATCRKFLSDRFDRGESTVFVATLLGVAVGFAQLYPSFSSTALERVLILNDVYVVETGRRLGVGTALLAAVEAHAFSIRACRVSLNVAQNNHSAQKLYAANGWGLDREFLMYHHHPLKV